MNGRDLTILLQRDCIIFFLLIPNFLVFPSLASAINVDMNRREARETTRELLFRDPRTYVQWLFVPGCAGRRALVVLTEPERLGDAGAAVPAEERDK